MKQFKARVISNKVLLRYPGTKYYLMDLVVDNECGEFMPGQFIMLKCGGDTLLRRPISVHSVLSDQVIEILYALSSGNQSATPCPHESSESRFSLEKGKTLLSQLKKGKEIDIIGPLGNGYTIDDTSKSLLLVAGGIGIAPLRFLAERASSLGKSVNLLMGAKYYGGLYPRSLLPETINVVSIVENISRHSHYLKGLVTDLLLQYMGNCDQVFACGPVAMYQTISDKLKKSAVDKPVQISLEVRMGCGFGLCYGCSIKTRQGMKRVCKDGPVFKIKDIIWEEVKL